MHRARGGNPMKRIVYFAAALFLSALPFAVKPASEP